MSASVRFALDVSSPLAPELLEAFIGAAERHGHSVFGFIEGDTLQLVASDEISQAEVAEVLLSRMHSEGRSVPSTDPQPRPIPGGEGAADFFPEDGS